MTYRQALDLARKHSPWGFTKRFLLWLFRWDFLQPGRGIDIQRNTDAATISVDLANLANYLRSIDFTGGSSSDLPFVGKLAAGNIEINAGTVYTYQDNATAVAAYSAATQASKYYYLEIQITYTTGAYVVTGTVQVGAANPTCLDKSGSPYKHHILLGTTDASGLWTQCWGGGDVHLADIYPAKSIVIGSANNYELSGDDASPTDGDIYAKHTDKGWHDLASLLTHVPGYDAGEVQVLMNSSGTVAWVTVDSSCS